MGGSSEHDRPHLVDVPVSGARVTAELADAEEFDGDAEGGEGGCGLEEVLDCFLSASLLDKIVIRKGEDETETKRREEMKEGSV